MRREEKDREEKRREGIKVEWSIAKCTVCTGNIKNK